LAGAALPGFFAIFVAIFASPALSVLALVFRVL
jgi:hypothetical protein